ncbi:hypothetical protein DEM27_10260 [Metarhizobium album]|uniref:Uncharacterized protein n=1 Tax=Metarhizobium album TaxID=2182425 RepID=A0A2U2DTW5_9HYPH|nr:hypothetical protein [Rhizobium album]PWE56737.1 hypothetical protein DEM27_10260 [Rhizobium album]
MTDLLPRVAKAMSDRRQELTAPQLSRIWEELAKVAVEACGWQPMDTAPKDRSILVDFSYWYPGDTSPTVNFAVATYVQRADGYAWDTGDEIFQSGAANGWIDIPATKIKPIDEEAGHD